MSDLRPIYDEHYNRLGNCRYITTEEDGGIGYQYVVIGGEWELRKRMEYLASDLDSEAEDLRRNAPGVADELADFKSNTARRIRKAIEGVYP